MKVYIVIDGIDCEGCNIQGVFDSEKKAKTHVKLIKGSYDYETWDIK